MCHLILMMPILGLAVFWFWPTSEALPIYTMILLLSAVVYFVIMRAMMRPAQTGREGMLHEIAEVIEPINSKGHVRVHGEIWQAVCSDSLRKGDHAEVIGMNGLTLRVKRFQDVQRQTLPASHCSISASKTQL